MHVRGSFALLAGALLCALVAVGAHYTRNALVATTVTAPAPRTSPITVVPPTPVSFEMLEMQPLPFTADDRAFLATLRHDFEGRLADARARVQLLERLLAYQQQRHPDAEGELFVRFLKEAFPLQAQDLFKQSVKLVRYRDWLAANQQALSALPVDERRASLWYARWKSFGPEADLIWSAERPNGVPIGTAMAAP